MSILFNLYDLDKNGKVINYKVPFITLTDYTITEVNWVTNSLEHDLDMKLHKDFESLIEIKGKLFSHLAENNLEEIAKDKLEIEKKCSKINLVGTCTRK